MRQRTTICCSQPPTRLKRSEGSPQRKQRCAPDRALSRYHCDFHANLAPWKPTSDGAAAGEVFTREPNPQGVCSPAAAISQPPSRSTGAEDAPGIGIIKSLTDSFIGNRRR